MAYERDWRFSFDNNYVPTTALDLTRYQQWALKAMLLNQLGAWSPSAPTAGFWTTYYSCDSVTAGTPNDGVDRWGAVYDGTKIVRGTAAAVRSWYVLRSPLMNGFNWYLLMVFDGVSDAAGSMYMSKLGFTGGTTTARPTATDEWSMNTSPTNINGGNITPHRFSMCLTTTGDFLFYNVRSGNGFAEYAVGVVAPVGTHVNDQYPIWTYRNYSSSFGSSGFSAVSVTASTAPVATRSFSGATSSFATLPYLATSYPTNSPDALTNSQFDLPCWLIVNGSSSAYWHARGRLPDLGYIPNSNTTAGPFAPGSAVRDGSNNVTHVSNGCFFIPANIVPNFV